LKCSPVNRKQSTVIFFHYLYSYMDTRIPKGQPKQLRTYSDLYPIMQGILLRQNKMTAKNEPVDRVGEYTGLWKASVERMKREVG
jgi:hypothetical protein